MLRLSQSSMRLIGLVAAVSASSMMLLIVASNEAAAKVILGVPSGSAHSSGSVSDARQHRSQVTSDTSQETDRAGSGAQLKPTVLSSDADHEEKAGVSEDVTSGSGATSSDVTKEESIKSDEASDKSASQDTAPAAGQPVNAEAAAPSTPGSEPATADANAPANTAPQAAPAPVTAESKKAESTKPAAADAQRTTSVYDKPRPKRAPRKPHPLAAAQPDRDVVVCEAGCSNANETPEVVYSQPVSKQKQITAVNELNPSSAGKAGAANSTVNMIVCLGGCYDTPKVYPAAIDAGNVAAGSWAASVVPTNAKPSDTGSGDWTRRIDTDRDSGAAKSDK